MMYAIYPFNPAISWKYHVGLRSSEIGNLIGINERINKELWC